MARAQRLLISVALVGATLSALHRAPLDDGFPISTYPMVAARRGTKLELEYALGVTAKGQTRSLPASFSGSSEVLQAASIYWGAVHAGGKRLAPLCQQVAREVAADPDLTDIVAVRIVHASHDSLALLLRDVREVEHVRWGCAVSR
ncbi:MAG: hypothetical protein ABI678_15260 [Kofleriaceae bacterium]